MNISPVSEDALLIRWADAIDPALVPQIAALQRLIERELSQCVVDLVPSYTTLLCRYDPFKMDHHQMVTSVQRLVQRLAEINALLPEGRLVEIPVWYAPEVGCDLISLAQRLKMPVETIIERHSQPTYQVYALGFSPGFAFMGQVDTSLVTPRHSSPRRAVAAGSVGIAETQTAVYPRQSPGGWQIIGRSPTILFDPQETIDRAALLKVGDQVRFRPIDQATFIQLGGRL